MNKYFIDKEDKTTLLKLFNIFKYKDDNKLQIDLEDKMIRINDGQCTTYNICEFCKDPVHFIKRSDTPCADALKEMRKQLKNECIELEFVKRRRDK